MKNSLDDLRREDMLRQPGVFEALGAHAIIDGRQVVCMSSNDYLALSDDPIVKRAAIEALEFWGVGACASRLICGTTSLHVRLQDKLAAFKKTQAAIVTTTGWAANFAAISVLVGAGDMILSDKLNHASIIDAALASGARLRSYRHCDIAHAEKILREHRADYRRCLIVTDSVFSMDGDIAPLAELVELKDRYNAVLLVDEAHATGVLGDDGSGAASMLGVAARVDVTVGTLSKAIGALGGFVAGRDELIQSIVNFARSYIFTTALPPAICAAAIAAMDVIRDHPQRRKRLAEISTRVRRELVAMGFDCGRSQTQIIPVILGQASAAVQAASRLMEQGYLVLPIRPPTIAKGSSRLRISLSSAHSDGDIDGFLAAMKTLAKDRG